MLFFEGCGRHGAALSVIVRRGLAALTVYPMQWRKQVRWIYRNGPQILFSGGIAVFAVFLFLRACLFLMRNSSAGTRAFFGFACQDFARIFFSGRLEPYLLSCFEH